MEKSNLIISIIIVVCIAAAVAAYGITNTDNAIFSDLAGLDTGSSNNGLNHSNANKTGINVETGSGSGAESGSGSGSGSSGSSHGSSGSGSGSGSGGGSRPSPSPSPSPTPQGPTHSSSEIKQIAQNNVLEEGSVAGTPQYNQNTKTWYVPIYLNGQQVSGMSINDKTLQISLE